MNRIAVIIRHIPMALVLLLSAGLLHASPGTDAFTEGQLDQAKKLLSAEVRIDDDVNKRILLGQIEMRQGEFKKALEVFETAAKQHPQNAEAQYWVGASAGTLAGNASIFKAAGHAKKARRAFEKTIELDPEHYEGHEGLVMYYLQAPGFLGGDKDEALALAMKTVSFEPINGRLLLASVYQQTKKPKKRAAVFEELMTIAPNDPRAFVNIGFAEQAEDNYAAAHDAFSKAAATTAEGEDAEISRQSARYQVGRTAVFSEERMSAGIASLTAYLEGPVNDNQLPGKDWATFRRGQLYALAGDTAAAKRDFMSAKGMTEDKNLLSEIKKATR
ncbi:MAG: tetratricopeptide repeat protein [Woeseiaceae bacterium]